MAIEPPRIEPLEHNQMTREKRQHKRIKINHFITYTCNLPGKKESTAAQGLLLNISTSGAMIETKTPIEEKSLILGNNSETTPRMVIGEVVYTDTIIKAEQESYGMYRTGIKFADSLDNANEFVVSVVRPGDASETPDNKTSSEVIPATSDCRLPEFNSDIISDILSDTDTELLIDIDDLLEEKDDDPEFDVLENLSIVLEDNDSNRNVTAKSVSPKLPVTLPRTQPVVQPLSSRDETAESTESTPPPVKKPVLIVFNTACVIVISLTVFISLFFIRPLSCQTDCNGLQLPFFHTDSPLMDISDSTPDPLPDVVTLVKSSIRSRRFNGPNGKETFIIQGLISTPLTIKPEGVSVTARIFDKQNLIIGKSSTPPGIPSKEGSTSIVSDNSHPLQKLSHFSIAFTEAPEKIVRYSVDID